ncbi:unnamed protein product [Moneuplotes crassus]|uniref:Growth arrest-specific protein 8 domain-containing protein n=2 Tax=Euplotes crassus TaxID=5936 RepID=A0AAD1UF81_EUPCR|nr:unnamed protein product [Moneuplotes crassus]
MSKKDKKDKPKKLTPEEEALQNAQNVNDIDDEGYKKSLRLQIRELEAEVQKEEDEAGLYQDERQRVNYFWIVAKKELEDKQADLRNKEREMQDLDEKHQIEIKVYKQRIKHLMFQNLDQLTELKKESEITLKNIEDEQRIESRELKADIRSLNVAMKEQEVRQGEYVRALKKANNKKKTAIRQEHERVANEIKMKYTHKMLLLRKEMEEKRKAMTLQIEAKKDKAIEDLIARHDQNYTKIKNYYQEITNTNLDVIKQMKDDLAEVRKNDQAKMKDLLEQKKINAKMSDPLKEIDLEVRALREKKIKFDAMNGELDIYKKDILSLDKRYREIEWEYEVKFQQYQYLIKEKEDLFAQFHKKIYDLHQKSGLKNLILTKQIETIQESIDIKEAQLNELLNASKIDQNQLKDIRSTLEESERIKNEAIKHIQQELKTIREAHSTMVKTYEGKLSEFGIPVEELGFDPLVPANI